MHDLRQAFAFRGVLLQVVAALSLCGCLKSEPTENGDALREVELTGSVGDGPVVGAMLTILGVDGAAIETLQSDTRADYQVLVSAPVSSFPLTIEASGGTDLVTNAVPDFTLVGALASPGAKPVANVNPYSTLAVRLATEKGGLLTTNSLDDAQDIVVSAFNNGLTTLATTGPMSTSIDESNIAEIVRASEILGEIVRRTRDIMTGAGSAMDGDTVVNALGSDLVDGVVDGRGSSGAEPRLAAVANLVSAQAVLEALHNRLRVNGADASESMRRAIDQVSEQPAVPALEDLTGTSAMIETARVGVAAAFAVTADPALAELASALAGLQPGMSGTLVGSIVPPAYVSLLGSAATTAGSADASVIEAVNEIARRREVSFEILGNNRPVIAGEPPPTVTAGSGYGFTPVASDVDGDALSFSVSSLPSWAEFDPVSGRLAGTPDEGDVGIYSGIAISVTDGIATASLPRFAIEVLTDEEENEEEPPAPTNRPPVIGGSPAPEVVVGHAYAFRPSASDADGDTLTFSVSGLPDWASFGQTNGRLTGTPDGGDVGVYSGIVISVSDGKASASLAPFAVSVVATALGSVTLSWTPPTENTDGSALTDLAAYRLYWGPAVGDYRNEVELDNPGLTTFVVENLAAGTWVFSITSVNAEGAESDFAAPVSTTMD